MRTRLLTGCGRGVTSSIQAKLIPDWVILEAFADQRQGLALLLPCTPLMLQVQHPLSCHITAHSRKKFIKTVCCSMTAGTSAAQSPACRKVAVIGAGAAGLVSIQELLREGHQVVGFEQGPQPGGTWVYDTSTDSDVLGAATNRHRVHGSMYRDLRTNLPRQIMGYTDAPFTPAFMGPASKDPRRYPGHAEVLRYLQLYADMHGLHQCIRFNTQVLTATPLSTTNNSAAGAAQPPPPDSSHSSSPSPSSSSSSGSCGHNPAWQLTSVELDDKGQPVGQPQQQVFDALLVCNGHYSEPNLPDVPGADSWPGLQMHSHNYRVPEAFAGQVVVVVGASNSGEDVCREVSAVAHQVVVAARSWKNPEWASDPRPFGPRGNVSRRGMVSALHSDGRVEFAQGPPLSKADAIIYCTGYRYSFPFLEQHHTTAHLSGQQYVPGLYQHMFVPSLGSTLSFVGLPWKVVPFPQFELQAKFIARLLSGRARLPPQAEMEAGVADHYQWLQKVGRPLRYCHMMDELQWPYDEWLAHAAGADVKPLASWRTTMYGANRQNKLSHPEDYRDRWDDLEVAAAAEEDLQRVAAEQAQLRQQIQQQGRQGSVPATAAAS